MQKYWQFLDNKLIETRSYKLMCHTNTTCAFAMLHTDTEAVYSTNCASRPTGIQKPKNSSKRNKESKSRGRLHGDRMLTAHRLSCVEVKYRWGSITWHSIPPWFYSRRREKFQPTNKQTNSLRHWMHTRLLFHIHNSLHNTLLPSVAIVKDFDIMQTREIFQYNFKWQIINQMFPHLQITC